MKKKIIMSMFGLVMLCGMLAGEGAAKVLTMEIPGDAEPGKNILWVNLGQLQVLSSGLAETVPAAEIALLDSQEKVMALFGSLRKGKCKWDHKTVRDRFLAVHFADGDHARLAAGIRDRKAMPGFRLALLDAKAKTVLQSTPIVFWDMTDLAVQMNYPVSAEPGLSIGQKVTVTLENRGRIAARDILLELVLSADDRIQWSSGAAGDDVLLENGSKKVPQLEAGQQVTVRFNDDLKIPENITPGKKYLAAVANVEDRSGDLDEENNTFCGFIMIAVPEPAAFVLALPETQLHFEPASYGFKIVVQDTVLSDGKDWKLCKMKPHVYQFKHVSWDDFFWEIDTYERAVWEIKGVNFCKKGGNARQLGIKVEVTGGSLLIPPSRFTLRLSTTELRFEPESKKFSLSAFGKPIFHLPFWWVCKRESYLYQMRFALWENYFWQVDTFKKEAASVSGGKFCTAEGTAEPLAVPVTVEK